MQDKTNSLALLTWHYKLSPSFWLRMNNRFKITYEFISKRRLIRCSSSFRFLTYSSTSFFPSPPPPHSFPPLNINIPKFGDAIVISLVTGNWASNKKEKIRFNHANERSQDARWIVFIDNIGNLSSLQA